jgi:purine catabolism regulator
MVKVANDPGALGADLTSRPDEPVLGIPLSAVLALPSAAEVGVHADAEQLQRKVTRASVLTTWEEPARPVRHHLVVVPTAPSPSVEPARLLEALSAAGASALAVAGVPTREEQAWRDLGDAAALPVLFVRDDASLERLVAELLGDMLDHQGAILQRVEDVHRVLASAGEVERAFALGCFDPSGRLTTETEPVGVRAPEGDRARRAMVRIAAGTLGHGLLAAFSAERVLTADDIQVLERAATVAALAITKEQAVSAVESKYRAEFLRDALAGRAGTPEEAAAHAGSLGWDISRRMVVVVAETDEDDSRTTRSPDEVRHLQQRFANAWVRAVQVRDPKCPVMGFSQEVVTLLAVPEEAGTEEIMTSVRGIARVVRGDGGGGRRTFSTGASRPITSLDELPQAYDEALNAVNVGRQMHGDGSLTHFDGLGIFRLLALIPDSADLTRFVEESLGELATDDSPDNAGLRETLATLLDTNMNVAETARLLFFHYNTLRYRISKLEKMLGPFSTDPQLRLTLALALKVHQTRSSAGGR